MEDAWATWHNVHCAVDYFVLEPWHEFISRIFDTLKWHVQNQWREDPQLNLSCETKSMAIGTLTFYSRERWCHNKDRRMPFVLSLSFSYAKWREIAQCSCSLTFCYSGESSWNWKFCISNNSNWPRMMTESLGEESNRNEWLFSH